MEKKEMPEAVPYIVFEGSMARCERTIKRLIICILVGIILLVATNAAWLLYLSNYEFSSESFSSVQDGHGINVIGGGDISNVTEGNDKTQDEKAEEP